MNNEAEGKINY